MSVGAIDIDGVLAETQEWPFDPDHYRIAEMVAGAEDALRCLKNRGHEIVLHTGRHWDKRHATTEWLKRNGLWQHVDGIVFGKPVADYYLDDRGVRFTSWAQAMGAIDAAI